jgi:hypothetical protein
MADPGSSPLVTPVVSRAGRGAGGEGPPLGPSEARPRALVSLDVDRSVLDDELSVEDAEPARVVGSAAPTACLRFRAPAVGVQWATEDSTREQIGHMRKRSGERARSSRAGRGRGRCSAQAAKRRDEDYELSRTARRDQSARRVVGRVSSSHANSQGVRFTRAQSGPHDEPRQRDARAAHKHEHAWPDASQSSVTAETSTCSARRGTRGRVSSRPSAARRCDVR